MTSRQTIPGPPAMPPLISLLQAVTILEDDPQGWVEGIQWLPEQIGGGGALSVTCAGNTPGGKPNRPMPDLNTADPFDVYAEDHCSTFGFAARDYEGRARRQLAAVQSARIAHEFQYRAVAPTNVGLIDAIEVTGGSATTASLIAALEGAMADKYDGGRGMIHVATQLLDELLAERLIYQAGQKWLTAAGTIVVADAGYGDEADTLFAYGTPMVQVHLSPVDVPMSFREAVDRATNDVKVYAERRVLVQVDHSDQDPGDLFFKVALGSAPWSAGS